MLMAPRAIGLGATQITFIVVTALATTVGIGALSDFNFAFVLLQIPLGIIGVPLGIVVLPTLSRDAAVGHEISFAALLTRALRLLVYVMVPITVLTVIVGRPVVEILFGGGKISAADLDLIAATLACLRGRADRARADRGPRSRLLRAPGHGHTGPRRDRRRRRQLQPGDHPRRAVRPAGHRAGDRHRRPGSRPSRCS